MASSRFKCLVMTSTASHPSRSRRGVALLLVVACIVFAGLAMVGVTRKSLRLATDSVVQEAELQQKWGTLSLQRTLLKSAPQLFLEMDELAVRRGKEGPFPRSIQSEVLLGGIKFKLLLADEQAKLNLNRVYHLRGKAAAEQTARRMSRVPGLRLRMLPEVESAGLLRKRGRSPRSSLDDSDQERVEDPPIPLAFYQWGQVFDLSQTLNGLSVHQVLPSATTELTCWGRGEINIARGSDEAVIELCRGILGPGVARKFVQEYRKSPIQNLNQIGAQLDVTEEELLGLRRLVTTESSTYSLWVTSDSLSGSERWFAVAEPVGEIGIKTHRFLY